MHRRGPEPALGKEGKSDRCGEVGERILGAESPNLTVSCRVLDRPGIAIEIDDEFDLHGESHIDSERTTVQQTERPDIQGAAGEIRTARRRDPDPPRAISEPPPAMAAFNTALRPAPHRLR